VAEHDAAQIKPHKYYERRRRRELERTDMTRSGSGPLNLTLN